MLNFLKGIYHYCLAWVGNILYGFPSRKIFVLGVTGTKGKSTTIELINAILEAAGKKTAVISSLRFKIDKDNRKNATSMTMPGRFFIQRWLRKAADAGCQYALIEVTSQGILQHRHRFIDWDAALITNLRPEHIDAHGSFENYRDAKLELFRYTVKNSKKRSKFFFINDEDPYKTYFGSAVNGSGRVVYYSREEFIKKELENGKVFIGDWLSSRFNLENAAAANAFVQSQNIPWPIIKKSLQNFKGVAGRLEMIQEKPFRVIIDYAHTPDSLEKVYQALEARNDRGDRIEQAKRSIINHRTSNLICVLGAAGGGRDKWKRPVMGEIASRYCKAIFLTNEDPYDENPLEIINQIESGFSQIPKAEKILDRKEAIKKAIRFAKKSDTVIITGKGSESWIHVAHGKRLPWNEREVVEEVIES
jgi:UDP-N-acetylmuramoyl-L-alanyl-D-glutamate--2,6-diaminopimelate ligase